MRPLMRFSFLGAVLLLLGFSGQGDGRVAGEEEARRAESPPNVIIILADDLGYGDLSSYGGWIKTPHLDRLAREGLRFTDFHASAPVCSPTRAGLLTGRYQQRAGIPGVIYASPERNRDHGMQPEEFTLAEMARKASYATGIFGKWHLGYQRQYNPTRQGFDEFVGYVSGNVDYISHVDGVGIPDWWKNDEKMREQGYSTQLITQHATQFIEAHKDAPFLLYLAHEAPHFPYQGPGDDPIRKADGTMARTPPKQSGDTAYVRSRYRRMVKAMDTGIGQVMQTLRRLDLAENTFVFFFSDNGPLAYGSAGALRGYKGSLFEGGHREPAVAWWPGHIAAGHVSETPAISLDLMPTLADLWDEQPPKPLDGTSLLPLLLEGKPLSNRMLFWSYREQQAVRRGPWKLVRNATEGNHTQGRQEGVALYNLSEDLDESKNLAAEHPERVGHLLDALNAWEEDMRSSATDQPGE